MIVADVDTPRNPASGRGARSRRGGKKNNAGLSLEVASASTMKSLDSAIKKEIQEPAKQIEG